MGWCCRVGPWPKGGTNPPQLTIRVNFEEGRLADRVACIRYGVGIKLEGACVSPTSIEAHARWAAGTACNEASMASITLHFTHALAAARRLGDGAANDRAAIHACFDRAAADKKFAVIPPGTWRVDAGVTLGGGARGLIMQG